MKHVVKVGFNDGNGKLYNFFTDLDLLVNDTVLVDTRLGFSVGQVMAFDGDYSKATKWVVCKIDLGPHFDRLERESRRNQSTTRYETEKL